MLFPRLKKKIIEFGGGGWQSCIALTNFFSLNNNFQKDVNKSGHWTLVFGGSGRMAIVHDLIMKFMIWSTYQVCVTNSRMFWDS